MVIHVSGDFFQKILEIIVRLEVIRLRSFSNTVNHCTCLGSCNSINHNPVFLSNTERTNGANANALYLTIVEMAKAYNINLYKYLKHLLEHRPDKSMSDDEIAELAPWSEAV